MNLIDCRNPPATYDDLLRNSISYFLREYPRSVSSSSDLLSIFYRLIRDFKDPPLEVIWFYGAVTFLSSKPSVLPPPRKLLVVKDLLQLLNSCSCFCNEVKKVALIAPVLYLLYHLELNFSATDPCLREEVRIVVEGIVSYASICCSQYLEEREQASDSLGVYVLDLIRFWTLDQSRENKVHVLASFFPILNSELQQEATVCPRHLAGVVMNEILLLRLCLKISPGINSGDLQRDMLMLAIQAIKGFQNFYFLEMLFKMLLEPSLPATALLNPEDATVLHKALYDAVILVEYSFYSGRWVQSSESYSKKLALVWVLVAERAIQFARATTDKDRANSYLRAFCESQLVAELIKWLSNQAGMADQGTGPNISTPKALIKWLLLLQGQGIEVFDHSTSFLHSKAVAACMSSVEGQSPVLEPCSKNKDQEMGEMPNNRFQDTLFLCRKRKETPSGFHDSRLKQVKHDSCGSEKLLPLSSDNGLHFVNEVKNAASDDDMEILG